MEFLQKNIKWVLAVVGFIFGMGVAWGILEYKVADLREKVAEMEQIKSDVDIIKGQNEVIIGNLNVLIAKGRPTVDQ